MERQLEIVQEKRTSASSDSYGNGDGKEEELEPSVYEFGSQKFCGLQAIFEFV